MEAFRNLNRSQWLSIIIVVLLTGTFLVFDGMRALGPVAGVEPLRLVNIGFTLTMAISGLLMWARRSQRFRTGRGCSTVPLNGFIALQACRICR